MHENDIVWQVVDLDAERTDKPTHPYRSRMFTSIVKALSFCWSVYDDWQEPCMRAIQLDVTPPDDGYLMFLTNGAVRPPKDRTDAAIARTVIKVRDELMKQLDSEDYSL